MKLQCFGIGPVHIDRSVQWSLRAARGKDVAAASEVTQPAVYFGEIGEFDPYRQGFSIGMGPDKVQPRTLKGEHATA